MLSLQKKREIRKEIAKLGFNELIRLCEEQTTIIKNANEGFSIINGPDGCKTHIRKAIDIERASFKLEYAAVCLMRGARIETKKGADLFIDSVMNMTSEEEPSD